MSESVKTASNTLDKHTSAFRTIDIAYIAIGVALMAVCSWISIPTTIPFTLQTFAVFVSVCLLGGFRGTIAVVIYLLLGAVGVPVFANMSGGMSALVGPTGGYLVGFLFSALVMWAFEKMIGKKIWMYAISMILALIVCYAFGTVWFAKVYVGEDGSGVSMMTALTWCVIPYILPDLAKIAVALLIGSNKALRRVIRNGENA